jgi:hypothetical protein
MKIDRRIKAATITSSHQPVKRHYSGSAAAVRSRPDSDSSNYGSSSSGGKSQIVPEKAAELSPPKNPSGTSWRSQPLQPPLRDVTFMRTSFFNDPNAELPYIKEPKERLRRFSVSTLDQKVTYRTTKGFLMPNEQRPIFRYTSNFSS